MQTHFAYSLYKERHKLVKVAPKLSKYQEAAVGYVPRPKVYDTNSTSEQQVCKAGESWMSRF